MTSILVKFNPDQDILPLELTSRVADQGSADVTCVVVEGAYSLLELVGGCRDVCEGNVTQTAADIPLGPIVLKFGIGKSNHEAVQKEFDLYDNQLKKLQGQYVPRCYGLYHGVTFEDVPLICLVLEHVGKPVEEPKGFASLDVWDRADIWQALNKIHLAGVQHNDYDERNVLFRKIEENFGPFVIDFENATPHKCKRRLKVIEGAMAPNPLRFGCEELWHTAMNLELWRPPVLTFFGLIIIEREITSAQALVDVAKRERVRVPDRALRQRAEKVWKRIERCRNNGGIRPHTESDGEDSDDEKYYLQYLAEQQSTSHSPELLTPS